MPIVPESGPLAPSRWLMASGLRQTCLSGTVSGMNPIIKHRGLIQRAGVEEYAQ